MKKLSLIRTMLAAHDKDLAAHPEHGRWLALARHHYMRGYEDGSDQIHDKIGDWDGNAAGCGELSMQEVTEAVVWITGLISAFVDHANLDGLARIHSGLDAFLNGDVKDHVFRRSANELIDMSVPGNAEAVERGLAADHTREEFVRMNLMLVAALEARKKAREAEVAKAAETQASAEADDIVAGAEKLLRDVNQP